MERELVIQALKETGGNQVHAAKLLGITRATLRKRIEKFGIQRRAHRPIAGIAIGSGRR